MVRKKSFVIPYLIKVVERILALIVIVGVIAYSIWSVEVLANMNWHTHEVLYELIYRVLLVTIGLELARMLITHSFLAILELLAFVIARKMLKPDLDTLDVFLGTLAFVTLLGANRYFIVPLKYKVKKAPVHESES
jgi:hypothetical protein